MISLQIDVASQQLLLDALDSTILSITEFLHCDTSPSNVEYPLKVVSQIDTDIGEDERIDKAWNLPEDLRTRQESVASDEKKSEVIQLRIQQLIRNINEVTQALF